MRTSALPRRSTPGVLELLGADVVNLNNESLGVGAEELLHLFEVGFFLFARERHDK